MSPNRSRHAVLVVAALSLAACARPSARPSAITLTDDWGRAVSLAAPARRIVSLAPASTELLFALGLGADVVGRTKWCDYPAAATRVPSVGNGIEPDVEAVAATHPDLVLLYASEANRAALGRFDALGISVLVLKLDLARDVRRSAMLIARAAGDSAAADTLLASFDRRLAAASRPTPPAPARPPTVYVDVESNPPITIGQGSYLTEIIDAAGARNAFGDIAASSAPVSLESVAARDPDVIVTLASDTAMDPGLSRRPGWNAVRAVREGRVLVLDGALYGRPSPRMPQAVADLARRLDLLLVTHRRTSR